MSALERFHCTHKKHNLYIHTQNTTKFGNKSLRAFGANMWNTLPEYIKSTTSLLEFKKFIKTWSGPKCKCSVCKWEWTFLSNMILVMHNILKRCIQSRVKYPRWSLEAVNVLKPLKTVLAERYTLGTWQGSEHASSFAKLYIWKGEGCRSRSVA